MFNLDKNIIKHATGSKNVDLKILKDNKKITFRL